MLERYVIPLAPYLLLSAGLFACTYIFYSLKKEIQALKARLGHHESDSGTAAQSVLNEVEEMKAQLKEAEERTAQLVPPPPARSGLNVNTRTQAIRMFRHGEDEQEIAAKLGLPRYEVKLLLKVHKLAVGGPPINLLAGNKDTGSVNAVDPFANPFTSSQAAN